MRPYRVGKLIIFTLIIVVPSLRSLHLCQALSIRGGYRGKSEVTATDESFPIASVTVPLHAKAGTHHAYIYVGSPPQRQTLIVDTGSRIMAFPCEPCKECGKHASASYFDPALSTTDVFSKCGECHFPGTSCDAGKCSLTQKYTEGSSWTAFELEDIIWLGTHDADESIEHHLEFAVPYSFGCQISETGLFTTQYADGILGLARHMGLARHQASIMDAIYNSGAIQRKAFSLCFTSTGGGLALGGTSFGVNHREPMDYTALKKDNAMYAVVVESVHVGDFLITKKRGLLGAFNTKKGTIIDSGTTDTYLPAIVADPFLKAWDRFTDVPFSNRKHQFSYESFHSLPVITFTFQGGVKITIRPDSYMEAMKVKRENKLSLKNMSNETDNTNNDVNVRWEGTRPFTNRIYVDEPIGAVLGANAMIGHDILFDIEGARIGIARADC